MTCLLQKDTPRFAGTAFQRRRPTKTGGYVVLAILGVLVAVCTPRDARGAPQPTVRGSCSPDDPKDCVQPLLEGEAAPFSGQLLTPRRAAKLAVEAGSCQERVEIETQRVTDRLQLQIDLQKSLRANDRQAHELQLDLLKKRLEQAEEILSPRWWERPAFVIPTTVVLTVGAVVLATWIVDSATPGR